VIPSLAGTPRRETVGSHYLPLAAGVIRLRAEHSKNGRPRVLVLRGDLLELVRRQMAVRRLGCPYAFNCDGRPLGNFQGVAPNLRGGRPRRAALHDMRRSAVRNMVRAGVPERVTMAVSGHRTRAVFDRYNIVSEDDLAAAAERVNDDMAKRAEEPPRVVALSAIR
jgi:integrase